MHEHVGCGWHSEGIVGHANVSPDPPSRGWPLPVSSQYCAAGSHEIGPHERLPPPLPVSDEASLPPLLDEVPLREEVAPPEEVAPLDEAPPLDEDPLPSDPGPCPSLDASCEDAPGVLLLLPHPRRARDPATTRVEKKRMKTPAELAMDKP
jgi:hypothetical protein